MRYGIISDIHGNLEAFAAVIEFLEDRLPREDPVRLVEHPLLVLEDREVLVLERVVVLVREVEPLGWAWRARLDTTYSLSSSLR